MNKIFFYCFLLFIVLTSARKSKDEWKTRQIYQIITDRFAGEHTVNCDMSKQPYYCGGTFQGIIDHLDYIKGMGFNAIWISPVPENKGNDFHGYAFLDLYKINPHFGGEQKLHDLVKACHDKDIWILLDVVANHVAPIDTNYGEINPFNKAEHYHDKCQIEDWNNQWQVENCRLCNLPDLKQENSWVKDKLCDWVNDIITTYDIDGLRVDTTPEVPKWFWKEFSSKADCYACGEVFNGNMNYVFGYAESLGSTLNYPLYFQARSVFGYQQSMKNFENYYNQLHSLSVPFDESILATFADNHDNPRFLSYQGDRDKLSAYVTFTLAAKGIPIVYYGSEQYYNGGQDPWNREALWPNYNQNTPLYKHISIINYYRQKTKFYEADQLQMYSDDDFYAFQRGNVFMTFTNKKYNIKRHISYNTLSDGKMCNIFNKSDCVQVSNHNFDIYLDNGESKIYVYENQLELDHPYYLDQE